MTVSKRSSRLSLWARPGPAPLLLHLLLVLLLLLSAQMPSRTRLFTRRTLRRRWPWRGWLLQKRRVALPYDRAYNLAGRTRGLCLGVDACEAQQCGDDRQH